ncbi:hypothetical protein [Bacteroides nordii]|nr:hypothetical protein [Bacteroides nordii]
MERKIFAGNALQSGGNRRGCPPLHQEKPAGDDTGMSEYRKRYKRMIER